MRTSSYKNRQNEHAKLDLFWIAIRIIAYFVSAIKAIVNEQFGDGIMSTVDVFVKVEKQKGKSGEDRVVITMNGKFLPHPEQKIWKTRNEKISSLAGKWSKYAFRLM